MSNGGVTQEVGSTARTVVQSLASTPVVLALVLFNVIYMCGTFYAQLQGQKRFVEATASWERMVDKVMAFCPHQSGAGDKELSDQAIKAIEL